MPKKRGCVNYILTKIIDPSNRELVIDELRSQLEQATASYREKESCGHTKNFLIGDEYGHFTCTLCQLSTTREIARALLLAAQAKLADCKGTGDCADAALMPGECCSNECAALATATERARAAGLLDAQRIAEGSAEGGKA